MYVIHFFNPRQFTIKLVCGIILVLANYTFAQTGIWTSSQELSNIPMSGPAWDAALNAADIADPNSATVSDQDSDNNVEILAAAIVYARAGTNSYKDKVVTAIEKLVAEGQPGDRTLAWARETGAYVMAADLVNYRTAAFETWCRNMAEVWIATDDRTMLEMFKKRPNNWGSMAFGSLAAIYVYLDDSNRLTEIRDYWIQLVLGPKPGECSYGSDLSWHVDENNPLLINPVGATKNGLNIDGAIPDDMRRGGSFADPPGSTGYPWEHLQGTLTAARILDRAGMSIWNVGSDAIFRAAYCLQVRFETAYGSWKADGDDEWQIPFLDNAYTTSWADGYDTINSRIWEAGKIAGWAYVTLGETPTGEPTIPNPPNALTATSSGTTIDLTWSDNSTDESGFKIERSEDNGQTFSEIANVLANTTQYSNSDLVHATEYCYQIRAYNSAGNSDYTNIACATTQDNGGPIDYVAANELNVAGNQSGDFTDTQSSDDTYESIQERESGGKPANRYSYLEHKWEFNIASGTSVTFFLEAYKTINSEGDDFVFSYSSNDVTYQDMLIVTNTTDNNTYQSYSLPASLSGTVHVRVQDTDRSVGNRSKDRIFIDHLFIRSESGEVTLPNPPGNLSANPLSSSSIGLSWIDNSLNEFGFEIEQSEDGGNTFVQITTVSTNVTDYTVNGLFALTEYCFRVTAYNSAGNSGHSNIVCVVTPEGSGPVDDAANSETAISGTPNGNFGDTQISDNVYESIEETKTGGKPSNRYTYLEHQWTINVTGGSTVTFYLEAHRTENSEGDDFIFSYSTDNVNYTDMLTVTKSTDDDAYQTFTFPNQLSGLVYIRVRDLDQSPGNRSKDRIFLDHMFIRSEDGANKNILGKGNIVQPADVEIPNTLELHQNYPNPFNPETQIYFQLPEPNHVVLKIFNVLGQEIRTLTSKLYEAGYHSVRWNSKDNNGNLVSSGVYLYKIQAGNFSQVKKMNLLR